MDALTISAANLNTIEKNLGAVADELSGVVSNVSTVTNQVNKVESQVATLNNEVKNLVKEIRETTIITNARQSIMYNNEQIEKKFSYYDKVRRTTESLLDAITNSAISRRSLYSLNQNILLNNPNYWLSNALVAVSSWILNDKANTDREVKNALKKDEKKTSLFFAFINLKLNREDAAMNWLKKYLSLQNPLELDKDFITVLDIMSSGILGTSARDLILNKIGEWFERLKNDTTINKRQEDIWNSFISDNEDTSLYMPYLDAHARNISILKHNLITTSSYHNVLSRLEKLMTTSTPPKSIDDILNSLIYDYESKEQAFQLDNLRNNLIIACNGDTAKASELYKKQEAIYHDKVDLITILSNIVIYDTEYNVSHETKKIALTLVKDYIIETYINRNKTINRNSITIDINNFTTEIKEIDRDKINSEINAYVEKEFPIDDKNITLILLVLNILGIIGIFITLENRFLTILLIAVLLIGDVALMLKSSNQNKTRNTAKATLQTNISSTIESVLAEITDYQNLLTGDEVEYNKLISYLNALQTRNYVKNNEERNINIGE